MNICPKNLKLSILEFGVFWNCLSWSTRKSSELSYQNIKSIFFEECWRINSKNSLFYIFFHLKWRRASTHIFLICLVQNSLSQEKFLNSQKSAWVLKLSVLKMTDKRLFIHPCPFSHGDLFWDLGPLFMFPHDFLEISPRFPLDFPKIYPRFPLDPRFPQYFP